MASIPEHIKNLLFEQDCVVVPDFGGFITNFHGAVVHKRDAYMLPPRKRVAFNEVLKFDDGLLTSYIAFKEARSREEVRTKIRLFTEQAWRELRLCNRFRFEHLGSFTLNAEGKLVFEPEHRINFFGESFGMTVVSLQPQRGLAPSPSISAVSRLELSREDVIEIVPEEIEPEETLLLNSRQRWLTFPNVAASMGIILLSLIGWIWFDGSNSTLSSLNPFSVFKLSEWKKKSDAQIVVGKATPLTKGGSSTVKMISTLENNRSERAPIEDKVVFVASVSKPLALKGPVRNVLVIPMRVRAASNEISIASGRYFVIAGGFGKAFNAQRLQKKLQAQGFDQATLLYPVKSRLIRVASHEFDTVQEAQSAAAESRSVLGNHVWVLKTK